MLRFISRRIAFIVLVLVAIIFFAYLGMDMMRNSDVAEPNYDLISQGKGAWEKTQEFLSNALKGDFGAVETEIGRISLADYLLMSYANSMGLLLVALLGAAVVGLYIGGLAALTRWKNLTLFLLLLTILGISAPSFFAGLLLRQGALNLSDTLGRRLVSMAGFGWDLKHMLMPVLVLAARPLAYLTRAAFLGLKRVMDEDYIRTAHSKGLTFRRIVNVHALRNVAVPMLTAFGVSIRFSLSTLPVVELFFSRPGRGLRLLEAMDARQSSVVVILASSLGMTFLLVNLLLDISFRLIDPRIRELE